MRRILLTLVVVLIFGAPSAMASSCLGDCDGDGRVTVDELMTEVIIIFGIRLAIDLPPKSCAALDPDGDGEVWVTDLLAAINYAHSGCQRD